MSRTLVFTSVSENIAEMAMLTLPNKAEYCLRHGYSLLADNRPYEEAVAAVEEMIPLFDVYDTIWTLDADAVITNMTLRIDAMGCLGKHVTACREDIVAWNAINCGSMVWRNTPETKELMRRISAAGDQWRLMPCGWQTWLPENAGDVLTVVEPRMFNSCVWTHPGGSRFSSPGGYWAEGDFVFHPCGVYPPEARIASVKTALEEVVR